MMLIDYNARFMWRVTPQSLMASAVNLKIAVLKLMRDVYKSIGLIR